jgi:response regulator of citrate/malate metabolism
VRKALRGGIVHYLIKPFSQTDLQERLEHYRNTYQSLDSSKDVAEQSDVNRVFGLERADRPLPKGCSVETLQVVEKALRAAGGDVSAAELAIEVGTSRVSARRYLEYLNDEGLVDVTLKYGVGRPERRYAWKAR